MNNNRNGADALSCANPQCHRREGLLRAEIDRRNDRVAEVEAENREKAAALRQAVRENKELKEKIAELQGKLLGHGKYHERTWPDELRRYLRNNHPNKETYLKLYRLCCREENMSARIEVVHPDLKLVAPRRRRHNDSDAEDSPAVPPMALPVSNNSQAAQDESPFPFERLPWQLQGEILKLVLHKHGKIIHCLSRLDPFVQPEEIKADEELGDLKSGLTNRFYWGKRACSITADGVDPQKVLAILSVSKRFYFLGVHIFYSLNTFSFSSLGEFGRFCMGSGLARVARIQHVELLLTGSQRLTCPPDTRNKIPMSRRTYPLSWFSDMYRLKTLVIHVNETGRQYVRRGHESPMVKKLLAAKTQGQPNRRMTRALRCLQGIDYVYQLRGLEWIRFYDFNKVLQSKTSRRVPIVDWSFAEDMTGQTTMPKPPKRQENSELEKLISLFPEGEQSWTPSADDWELVKTLFIDRNGRCSYDDLRIEKSNRDTDLASWLSIAGTARGLGSSSDSDTDGEESSSSESDSDAGPTVQPRPRQPQRRRHRSESPLFVSDGNSMTDTNESKNPLSDSSSGSSNASDSDSPSESSSSPGPNSGSDPSDSEISGSRLFGSDMSISDSDLSGSDMSDSDSDSDSSSSSTNSFNAILSAHSASRTPSITPSSRGSSASTTNTSTARNRIPPPTTPRPRPFSKRESTGLFVTPGPPNQNQNRNRTTTQTPRQPQPHTPAFRRGSTASGMFVTPGPPRTPAPAPAARKVPVPVPASASESARHVRRESTASGMFVTPGPPRTPAHATAPAPARVSVAVLGVGYGRRESISSGAVGTPGLARGDRMVRDQSQGQGRTGEHDRNEDGGGDRHGRGETASRAGSSGGDSVVIDLTVDGDDDDGGEQMVLDGEGGGGAGSGSGFRSLETLFEDTSDGGSGEEDSDEDSSDESEESEGDDDDDEDDESEDDDGTDDDTEDEGDNSEDQEGNGMDDQEGPMENDQAGDDVDNEDGNGVDVEMENANDNNLVIAADGTGSDAGNANPARGPFAGLQEILTVDDSDADANGNNNDSLFGSDMGDAGDGLGGAGLSLRGGGSLKRPRSRFSDGGSSDGKRLRRE